MRSKPELRLADYLDHIIDAISRIERYAALVAGEKEFQDSALIQDAIVRNLEIVGEAAQNVRRVAPDFAAEHADVPWELMYAMRNRITHGYFDINLPVVWQTVRKDLPVLAEQIRHLLDSVKQSPE